MVTSEWPTDGHKGAVPFIVQQVNYLRKAGIDINVFPFRGNKNPLNYLKAWLKLRRTHDFKHYDLIHAQFGQSGIVALPTILPMVVTFWGSDLHGIVGTNGQYSWLGFILQFVSRYVAKKAKEIILVSEHLSQYLSMKLPYHVIPHGVDLELFRQGCLHCSQH